jgi:hypothetical protein
MAHRFASRTEPQGGDTAIILTAAMFFGKMGSFKYADPNQFLAFGETLRDEDEESLAHFFDLAKEGLLMSGKGKKLTDRGGRSYSYITFLRAGGPDGAKVVLFGNIAQFIKDYHNRRFRTDFTLNDLIDEAHKG